MVVVVSVNQTPAGIPPFAKTLLRFPNQRGSADAQSASRWETAIPIVAHSHLTPIPAMAADCGYGAA